MLPSTINFTPFITFIFVQAHTELHIVSNCMPTHIHTYIHTLSLISLPLSQAHAEPTTLGADGVAVQPPAVTPTMGDG